MITKRELLADWSNVPSLLIALHSDVSAYESRKPPFPGDDGSKASVEMSSVEDKQKLWIISGQSSYLIESAGDHLSAFATLLTPPVHSIAIYGCVRNLLEVSAKALWLLDPEINEVERIGRSFGMRYRDLREQQKLAQANSYNPEAQEFWEYAEARIKELDREARSMGYEGIRDKKRKKKISGIGRRMPTSVELCAQQLECSKEYRVLSGVSHGQFSVVKNLSFRLMEEEGAESIAGDGAQRMVKEVDGKSVVHFSMVAFRAFAAAIWWQANYIDWRKDSLADAFDRCADGLTIDADARFWR